MKQVAQQPCPRSTAAVGSRRWRPVAEDMNIAHKPFAKPFDWKSS